MARIERLRVYPVKALDGEDVEAARIAAGGTLAGDRVYAMFGPDGRPINGKRTARVHDLTTSFDLDEGTLTLAAADGAARFPGERREFDIRDDREAAEEWLSLFFDVPVTIRRDPENGFVDRREAGPSVVSTATLEELASWYEEATVDGMRRRLRPNVEVGDVEPFWEDQFVESEGGSDGGVAPADASGRAGTDAPAFEAGDVRLVGVEPCGRCVVPERDPDTGERDPSFRERFVERRRTTMPGWVDSDAFDHYYAAMLIADVPDRDRGEMLRVGDDVRIVE